MLTPRQAQLQISSCLWRRRDKRRYCPFASLGLVIQCAKIPGTESQCACIEVAPRYIPQAADKAAAERAAAEAAAQTALEQDAQERADAEEARKEAAKAAAVTFQQELKRSAEVNVVLNAHCSVHLRQQCGGRGRAVSTDV
jgi:hypothetical protein